MNESPKPRIGSRRIARSFEIGISSTSKGCPRTSAAARQLTKLACAFIDGACSLPDADARIFAASSGATSPLGACPAVLTLGPVGTGYLILRVTGDPRD